MRNAGFTLIEILIVFSILAIISAASIASLTSYNNSQKLSQAALNIKSLLIQARSSASSQAQPAGCVNLQAYEVRICCIGGGPLGGGGGGAGCPTCLSFDSYELDAVCSSAPVGTLISSTKLSSGISIDSNNTTQRLFHFFPITGGVAAGGSVVLDGANSATKTITVTTAGVIQ